MSAGPESANAAAVRNLVRSAAQASGQIVRAFAHIRIGVVMWDAKGNLLVANRRFFEIFGLEPEDVPVGTAFRDFAETACSRGALEGRDPEEFADILLAQAARAASLTWDDEWPDGRVIAIEQRPDAQGGWIATFEDISERRAAQAQLTFLNQHDALTSLVNRDAFTQRLGALLARARSIAVLYVDLDRFKANNEALGHHGGDTLLRLVGMRLANTVRPGDLVARLGGDEFGVMLGSARRREQALAYATRVIEVLRQPFDVDGRSVLVDASIGIAMAPADGHDAVTLLRNADLALLQAKSAGRGVARMFAQEMADQREERRLLEADLRRALERGELRLFYQPIVDAKSGKVASFEALMRWQHPTRGMVPPIRFIPIAEESGLIVPMGAWALRRACIDAAQWPAPVKVAVNLSAAQFRNGDLCREAREALALARLPAERLELEVTESVLIHDANAARTLLGGLREAGLRIALDDFGTGYSSLSYLSNFAFDKIKIDKSFVDTIGQSRIGDAVVRAVSRMAAELGVQTVAEGVESAAQREKLCAEGISHLQGYFFSRPVPQEAVARVIGEIDNRARK